ncbi:tripartite motif-containing protein 2-like [Branchiostoma floridae x Branchiostoma japonicum]
MASNAISEITDEFLVCQICSENFKQPKVLPCLHTFCQPCLERLLAAEPVGKLDCPTCRQDVPLPENGVQGLKSNFLVGKLHDILQQSKWSAKGEASEPEEDGVPCMGCEKDEPVKFYCLECTDYLCQVCNDAHRRLKSTRAHEVVTVQDVQSGDFASELRARETSKCETHNELHKFYCDTCHRVICLHCVVTAHKDHQYVEIEKAVEREGAKIKAKLATVKNTVGLHEEWVGELRSIKDNWSSQVQRTEEQIEKQATNIINAVKKIKQDRIGQLRTMNTAREKQLRAAMEAAEMDLASAKSCVQFTDNVLEYGSPGEVMSVARELTRRLDETSDKNAINKAVKLIKSIADFTLDPQEVNVMEEVAKLVGRVRKTRIPMLGSSQTKQVRTNVVMSRSSALALDHIKTVGKEGSRDGQFSTPLSLAVTTDGFIVVAEFYNERLQILDKDGSFKTRFDLWFKPSCVAALTNGELLVTGNGNRIHVLNTQCSRVIQVKRAAAGEDTKGIAVDGLGRIIVTIGCQVFALSPSGDVMVKFGGKGQGQQQLSSSLRVAVNSSNHIIISDNRNNNIKVFDPSGGHLYTCGSSGSGHGQLDSPYCAMTDSEDNIIVAEFGNHRVSMFGSDGTFMKHVITQEEHGLFRPMGVALSQDGHLVISQYHSVKFFK